MWKIGASVYDLWIKSVNNCIFLLTKIVFKKYQLDLPIYRNDEPITLDIVSVLIPNCSIKKVFLNNSYWTFKIFLCYQWVHIDKYRTYIYWCFNQTTQANPRLYRSFSIARVILLHTCGGNIMKERAGEGSNYWFLYINIHNGTSLYIFSISETYVSWALCSRRGWFVFQWYIISPCMGNT